MRGPGGAGMALLSCAVVAEEVGRSLAAIPVLEHWVASALMETVMPTCPQLDEIAAGATIATLALTTADDGWWRHVPAGNVADLVIGWSRGSLVVAGGVPPRATPNVALLPLADRAAHPGDVIGASHSDAWGTAMNEWRVLHAAAQVGVAQRALELAVDYARERRQFGQPIGAFQAIQHSLADLVPVIDGGRLLAWKAAWSADALTADHHALGLMASRFCCDAAMRATAVALHIFGGYGVMEEYDVQLFYRRARGWGALNGDPWVEYLALAADLFDTPGP